MTPIRHTTCGGIAMWYIGPNERGNEMRSQDIVYVDGSRPEYMSILPHCPVCGGYLYPWNMERRFDQEIDK